MLLARRAIFGVVSLHGHGEAALETACGLTQRAERLGAATRLWRSGPAVLGTAAMGCEPDSAGPAVIAGDAVNARELALELTGSIRPLADEPAGLLIRAYDAWGARFLCRLDGIYSAAVWDPSEQRLLVGCDERGDAHVYYCTLPDRLVFSSWGALLADLAKGVDPQAAKEFLRFLYVAPPRTIYEGISRLGQRQYLRVEHATISTPFLPDHMPNWSEVDLATREAPEILDTFEDLLVAAVHRRLGDRRVGLFMSGGIDSTTLAAIHRKAGAGHLEAFTVGFDELGLDESELAAAHARHLGLAHRRLVFRPADHMRAFDRITRGFDQPFADPAGLPLALACEAAAQETELLAAGTGADDLFGVWIPRHLLFSLVVASRLPAALRIAAAAGLRSAPFPRLRGYARLFDFDDVEEIFVTWAGWTRAELSQLLGEPVSLEDTAFYRLFLARRPAGPQALYDALGVLPPDDCRGEAAGLAGSVLHLPYHDPDLASFVRQLPPPYRIAPRRTKVLLQALHARYFPEAFRKVKKRYFNFPLGELLARDRHALVRRHLAPEVLARCGIVDPRRAWRWIERYLAGDTSLLFKVWALLVLHAWLEAHRSEANPS